MTEHRERMMSVLNTRFVPALRERGFCGSFPHFRRSTPERMDHLTVQFYSAALPDGRRVVFDRGWNEKRLFAVIAQNLLDYTG
jgi:hypothetical protein